MLRMADEWRKQDEQRRAPDSVEHWNKRSTSYAKGARSGYAERFIDAMQLVRKEVIFDMGCGTGSLAIPLAIKGHRVIAADFSKGMLEQLSLSAEEAGISLLEPQFDQTGKLVIPASEGFPKKGFIIPLAMSWEDDWQSFGIAQNSVDVAIASRSLITHDLEDSLKKLSAVAQKKVCVTVGTGISPRVDPVVAQAMGIQLKIHNDALFVFGIAHELGFEPEVSYIHSPRTRTYASYDEAYSALLGTMDYVNDHAEQVEPQVAARRLQEWLQVHLVKDEQSQVWHLDKPHMVPWAFISWKV